jgi:hypothetical protein
MANVLWADVSEFQVPVDDRYPHSFFCLRSNDGGHRDSHFSQNLAWANKAVASGKLFGYLVYYFYRPRIDAAAILRAMVGTPNPRMGVMIDVEADGGKVSGNQSSAINTQYTDLANWLGDKRRVVGYGNVSDLNNLWPQKPAGLRIVIAAYGTNPDYPGKFAHQYSSTTPCAPFGPCDANSADNMSQADMEQMFGWAAAPAPTPPATTYQSEGDVFLEEPDGTVLWFIADGVNSYYRPLPANAAAKIPASARIKDDGSLKALWKVGAN